MVDDDDADNVDDADAATAGNDETDTAAAVPITETSFIVIVDDMVMLELGLNYFSAAAVVVTVMAAIDCSIFIQSPRF